MPTLKDIAKEAGVNISTVSKALMGKDDINTETAARVQTIARQMGYKYRKTESKRSKVIGVLCPEVLSNYYSQLIACIEGSAKKAGYSLFVGFSNYNALDEGRYFKQFYKANVDGILYVSENTNMEDVLKKTGKMDVPVVVIAQNGESRSFDCIRIDDDYGVRLVVEHMISKGHREIGYIGDVLCDARKRAFLSVLREHRIIPEKEWLYTGNERFEECGYLGMKKIFSKKPYPAAVFAAYDNIAIGAVKVIREKGLSIPDDISIAAIDNIRISQYLYPGLTTVASPVDEMARVALTTLVSRIESGESRPTQSIMLNPELIIRGSVKDLR